MSERQLSTFRKGFGEMELTLLDALNRAKIDALWNKERRTMADRWIIPDLTVPVVDGLNLACEVMGKGSNSDDAARHITLLQHGMFPLYFSNKQVKHSTELCVRQIRQTRQILRAMLP